MALECSVSKVELQIHSRSGFTLIETLIALVVFSLVATVLLESHLGVLRREQATGWARSIRQEVERISTTLKLTPEASQDLEQSGHSDLKIESRIVSLAPNVNGREWRVMPIERPSAAVTLFVETPVAVNALSPTLCPTPGSPSGQ